MRWSARFQGATWGRALSALVICWALSLPVMGQAPVKQWDRTYGGSDFEFAGDIARTNDGGYIVGGQSLSGNSGDRSDKSRGSGDIWVLKLDATGLKSWDRAFGGSGNEALRSIRQTTDGGYIIGGVSDSGISGDKSESNFGSVDVWVVKLDAQGRKQWDHRFGGSDVDSFGALQQTSDGGYIVGCTSASGISGNKTAGNLGGNDFWVLKLDVSGSKQWERTYGGSLSDEIYDVVQTTDGGYAIGGHSASGISATKSQSSQGQADYWLLKLDAQGSRQWDKTLGGAGTDLLHAIQQTTDGGYILGGQSDSGASGDKSQSGRGSNDYWVVKLTAQGTKQWDATLGGSNYDDLRDVIQTAEGGYALAGSSYSGISGDKSQPSNGNTDRWVVKLDAQGAKQWDVALGGASFEDSNTILQNMDGSYVVVGSSSSGISGDKSEASRGGYDYWLTKLVPTVAAPVSIAGDSVLCLGSRVQLTASAGPGASYVWSTGATTASIFVSQGGTYTVQANYPTGLSASAAFHVVARPPSPSFTLGADTSLCPGQQLLLRGPSPATPGLTYQWSDGSTGTTLLVQQAGTYQLTISGCTSQTVTRQVSAAVCPVSIPNVITPNGDRYNENFVVKGLSAGQWALTVYNRWGTQVYKTENYQAEWGSAAASGLYFYQLHQLGTTSVYKGWVEVIK